MFNHLEECFFSIESNWPVRWTKEEKGRPCLLVPLHVRILLYVSEKSYNWILWYFKHPFETWFNGEPSSCDHWLNDLEERERERRSQSIDVLGTDETFSHEEKRWQRKHPLNKMTWRLKDTTLSPSERVSIMMTYKLYSSIIRNGNHFLEQLGDKNRIDHDSVNF